MKVMICEMCNGNRLIKQDGLYVCQHCGTMYSAEEARKLLVEGTVKIDHTDELNNLYQVARRARSTKNSENAQKFYEQILVKDPSSWEANFYSIYYQSMNCTVGGIKIAANRITNIERSVLNMLKNSILEPDEQKQAAMEMAKELIELSTVLTSAARNHYYEIGHQIRNAYTQEYVTNCFACRDILYIYGDLIEELFNELVIDISIPCWQTALEQHKYILQLLSNKKPNKKVISRYHDKINHYIEAANAANHCDQQNRKKTLRKGMKVCMIICIALAVIYALISIGTKELIGLTVSFTILAIMFLLLGFTPKKSTYMFGKPFGMKRSTFILICLLSAFWLLVIIAGFTA